MWAADKVLTADNGAEGPANHQVVHKQVQEIYGLVLK